MQFRQPDHAGSLDVRTHRAVFTSVLFADRDAMKFSLNTADVCFPARSKAVHTVCIIARVRGFLFVALLRESQPNFGFRSSGAVGDEPGARKDEQASGDLQQGYRLAEGEPGDAHDENVADR